MRALLISGGTPPSSELLLSEVERSDYIIGIDKGLECLYKENIEPDIIVGDFDSVDRNILDKIITSKKELLKYPPEKDYTDTQLAVNKALEMMADEIVILGGTGSRVDHSMANIGLLYQCMKKGKRAYIKDVNNTLFMIDKNSYLEAKEFQIFSLVAFGGFVKKLNIKGAKYELNNYDLFPQDNITISNEFIGERVKVSFETGDLLVIYSKD